MGGGRGASDANPKSPKKVTLVFPPVIIEDNTSINSISNSKIGGKKVNQVYDKKQNSWEKTKAKADAAMEKSGSPVNQKEVTRYRKVTKVKKKIPENKPVSAEEEPYFIKKDVRVEKRKSHKKECICKPSKKWWKRIENENFGKRKEISASAKNKVTRKVDRLRLKNKKKRSKVKAIDGGKKEQEETVGSEEEVGIDSGIEVTIDEEGEYEDQSEDKDEEESNKWVNFINGLRS